MDNLRNSFRDLSHAVFPRTFPIFTQSHGQTCPVYFHRFDYKYIYLFGMFHAVGHADLDPYCLSSGGIFGVDPLRGKVG